MNNYLLPATLNTELLDLLQKKERVTIEMT